LRQPRDATLALSLGRNHWRQIEHGLFWSTGVVKHDHLTTLHHQAKAVIVLAMELFGIAASIPGAFVMIALYRLILLKVVARFRWATTLLRPASYVLLGLFAVEIALLVTLGAIQSRALIGPVFFTGHTIVFFLGTPALANIILLRKPAGPAPKWYVVSSLCTVLAFFLVLLQYHVSEQLFGIDGIGGPYI
jgi:hypothetical protein